MMDTRNITFFLVFAVVMLIFELVILDVDSGWSELLILVGITSFLATLLKSWLEKKMGRSTRTNDSNSR